MSPGDQKNWLKLVIICVEQLLLEHSRRDGRESSKCMEHKEEERTWDREIGQLLCPGVLPGTTVVWRGEERNGRQKTKSLWGLPWEDGKNLFWTLCISQKVASLHSHLLAYLTKAKSSRKWKKCYSFPIMWYGRQLNAPALLIPKEIQDDSISH